MYIKSYLSMIMCLGAFYFSPVVFAGDTNQQSQELNAEELQKPQTNQKFFLPEPIRMFFKFMLDAKGRSEEVKLASFNDAIVTLEQWNKVEGKTIAVNSLEEYLDVMYRHRENFTHVPAEIKYLKNGKALHKPIAVANSQELADEIEMYNNDQLEKIYGKIKKWVGENESKIPDPKLLFALAAFEMNREKIFASLTELQYLPQEEARQKFSEALEPLKSLDRNQRLDLVGQFESMFDKMDVELKNIGRKVTENSEEFDVKMGEVKGIGRFIQLFIGEVFKNTHPITLKNMISGLIDYPDQQNDMQRFSIVLKYGNPMFTKFIQLVARMDGISEEFQKIFIAMESSSDPVPLVQILDELLKEEQRMKAAGINVVSVSPAFHAGTIAQMHDVALEIVDEGGNKEVIEAALRVVMPGTKQKIARGELNLLASAKVVDSDEVLRKSKWPKLEPSVKGMTNGTLNDIDTEGASLRQIQAFENYTHSVSTTVEMQHRLILGPVKFLPKERVDLELSFRAPKIYYYSSPGNYKDQDNAPRIMIMEKVKGKKLEKLRETHPEVAEKVARHLIYKWVKEAFFESGFIHADLHFGNFMVDVVSEELISNASYRWSTRKQKMLIDVNIIDYGMGGIIELDHRKAFISLVLASKLKNPQVIRDILWGLSQDAPIDKKEFVRRFNETYTEDQAKPKDQRMKAKDYVIYGMDQGLVFPDQFISLSRGTGILITLANNYGIAHKLTALVKLTLANEWGLVNSLRKNNLIDYERLSDIITGRASKVWKDVKSGARDLCRFSTSNKK